MSVLRGFFDKPVAISGSDPAPDDKHLLFKDSEKAQHVSNHIPSPSSKSCTRHRKLSRVIKLFFLACALVFTFFFGHPILTYATLGYQSILRNSKHHDHIPCGHVADADKPVSIAAPPIEGDPVGAKLLDRTNWGATCSSNNAGPENKCEFSINGTDETYWRSDNVTGGTPWIVIDLKQKFNVHSLSVSPSLNLAEEGGRVQKHWIEVATEKEKFSPVAFGTWPGDAAAENSTFEPREARYVKLTAIDTTGNASFVEIANINIFAVDKIQTSPALHIGGRWGLTLTFPMVPVTAFMNPISRNLTVMAANAPDSFSNGNNPKTHTATWDLQKQVIEEKIIGETGHEMFCPGTSFNEKGNLFITGGSDAWAITLYNSTENQWSTPKNAKNEDMKLIVGRGYHGQTYLPDGNTFMIGGWWNGDKVTPRDGELYNATNGTMRIMKNIKASIIDMAPGSCPSKYTDPACENKDWQEHHPWLYAWKEDTVFHAGPSKQMNWIYTKPTDGAYKGAGLRNNSGDAVCGIAAMYDAAGGIILTAGGAPNYHYWVNKKNPRVDGAPHRYESTKKAYEIKLGTGAPGAVTVDEVTPMNHQRIFANSVILPTGQTLVVGGQRQGEPFLDETWEPIPEIYTPGSPAKWTDVAPHSTPRPYHSWAMLLPNATVLVGGGGLGGNEWKDANHYDAQIYEPPYFFKSDGSANPRPTIKRIDRPKAPYKVGEKIIITTDVKVDTTASLIRYSAATHALNNDLRRIKLTLKLEGTAGTDKKYSAELPKEPGVALPGYWMLFVLRDRVPSHAATVQILA